MEGGGGSVEKKNVLHWALEAHEHISTYGTLIDTALYVMLLIRANPLLGQVGGGWALDM